MIGSELSLLALLLSFSGPALGSESLCEPVALARAPEADSIFAACADGSIVRLDGREIAGEWRVARALADAISLDDRFHLAAVDPEAGEVLLVADFEPFVEDRRPVRQPSSLVQAAQDLIVASTCERRLTRISLARSTELTASNSEPLETYSFADSEPRTLELPFGPGEMLWCESRGWLIVADAFGGWLGVVDVQAWKLLRVHEISAHNIRGLRLSQDDRLHVAHQILDPLAHSSFEDLHWGNLLRNVVREIALDQLLIPEASTLISRVLHLGDAGHGAGDPSALLLDSEGNYLVTLAGTDELLKLDRSRLQQQRWPVGDRPVAALSLDDGRTCVVADSLSDSISFVDVKEGEVTTVSLGSRPSDDLVEQGRRLFFDARLSHDGWMSCHSCHSEGHTSGQLADTLSDGSYGTPKRVLSLRGVRDTAPYAWSGGLATLEAQIEKTLRETMHSANEDPRAVRALSAYLRTLPAPLEAGLQATATNAEAAKRGAAQFEAAGCVDCHTPPLFTSADAYAVGLIDEAGLDEFNPPSLRGVARRSRLFHDGRYRALEELLAQADHPGTDTLDEQEISDVAEYLRTL